MNKETYEIRIRRIETFFSRWYPASGIAPPAEEPRKQFLDDVAEQAAKIRELEDRLTAASIEREHSLRQIVDLNGRKNLFYYGKTAAEWRTEALANEGATIAPKADDGVVRALEAKLAEMEHQMRAANAEKVTAVERLGWDVPVIKQLREECKRLGVWGDSAVMSFQNLVRAIGERRALAAWNVYTSARFHDFAKGPWVAP